MPEGYDAGSVYISVIPSFRGWTEQVDRQAAEDGRRYGAGFNREAQAELRRGRFEVGPGRDRAARDGVEQGGAFATSLKARVAAALRNLPRIEVDANSTPAERKIAELRAQLLALHGANIGVDLDAGAAVTKMAEIEAALRELNGQDVSIDVRLDAARAIAELAEFRGAVEALDGQDVSPRVDPSGVQGASGAVSGLLAGLLLISPALIPIGAAFTATFVGAAATVGVLAGAVGVLALGLSGIGKAVSEKLDTKGAAKSVGAANSVRSAIASLENTRANAASQAISSAQAVERAETDAARGVQTAIRQEQQAERDLAATQKAATKAQQDLIQARKDAQRQMQDLADASADASLAQRQAALDLQDAQRRLNIANSNPLSTDRGKAQAQLDLDAAKQRLAELTRQQQDAAQASADANAKGVEGSDQVVAATEGVADAQQAQLDAQRQLADAQAGIVQAQVDGAQKVTDAQRAQADQARQSAFSIAQAQEAVRTASAAGTAAAAEQNDAFGGLPPILQDVVQLIVDKYVGAFRAMRKAAQEGLGPGLLGGLLAALPVLDPLTKVVGNFASALGGIFLSVGRGVASPFWLSFIDFIGTKGPEMLRTFAGIVGGFLTGFAKVFVAFQPLTDRVGAGLLRIAQRFASFDTKGKGFQGFLKYVSDSLPRVARFFESFGAAIGRVVQGAAPVGTVLLVVFTKLFNLISRIPVSVMTALVAGVVALAAAAIAISIPIDGMVLLIGAAVAVVVFLYEKFGLLKTALLVVASVIGGPIGAIALLTFGLMEAYKHVGWFRDIVDTAFSAIKTIVSVWWNDYVLPIFTVLSWWFLTVLPGAALFLWHNAIEPAFGGISAVISTVWEHGISPVFDGIKSGVGSVGDAFRTAAGVIGSAWSTVQDLVKTPINWVIDKVLNNGLIDSFNWIKNHIGLGGAIGNIPHIPLIGGTPNELADARSRLGVAGIGFASGGILPGYTPGRDVHSFYSPTAGLLHLSGGEGILRPEVVRFLGADLVHALNAMARGGGMRFAGGGVLGGALGAAKSLGSGALNLGGKALSVAGSPVRWLLGKISEALGVFDGAHIPGPFGQILRGGVSWAGDRMIDVVKGTPGRALSATGGFLSDTASGAWNNTLGRLADGGLIVAHDGTLGVAPSSMPLGGLRVPGLTAAQLAAMSSTRVSRSEHHSHIHAGPSTSEVAAAVLAGQRIEMRRHQLAARF